MTKEQNVEQDDVISMRRATFWISLSIVVGSFIATVVTAVMSYGEIKTNIAMLDAKYIALSVEVERIKTEGTRLAQTNTSQIAIYQIQQEYIKTALTENAVAHKEILEALKEFNKKFDDHIDKKVGQ